MNQVCGSELARDDRGQEPAGGSIRGRSHKNAWSRRRKFLARIAGLCAALLASRGRAAALPELEAVTRGAPLRGGRVKLDIPRLAEAANSIPCKVTVESAMTADDHVRAIHLFAPKNPRPALARFHLGPRCGRAEVATRIRLSGTQRVLAVAELSDGSFWSAEQEVAVTISACYDGS
jgi:sulfur-oxidizing protein SoxY